MNETLTAHKETYKGHLIQIDQILVPASRFISFINGEQTPGWSQSWSVMLGCAKGVVDAKLQRNLAFRTMIYQAREA